MLYMFLCLCSGEIIIPSWKLYGPEAHVSDAGVMLKDGTSVLRFPNWIPSEEGLWSTWERQQMICVL